ncbi:uncharacterized protein LOC135372832 [Ornithodoros turicata]|uniref:uncharacterized protein LOC135372832 n=1 Tax=Ornithodoros turicata TaxID=34597 RepID=UPI0031386AC4
MPERGEQPSCGQRTSPKRDLPKTGETAANSGHDEPLTQPGTETDESSSAECSASQTESTTFGSATPGVTESTNDAQLHATQDLDPSGGSEDRPRTTDQQPADERSPLEQLARTINEMTKRPKSDNVYASFEKAIEDAVTLVKTAAKIPEITERTSSRRKVPHNAIVEAVCRSGAGEAFTEIVRDLFTENTTRVATGGEETEPINIKAGIRQGCPLSGLLFNMVIDVIIRTVQGADSTHRIFAYADDIAALAQDPSTLQDKVNTVATLARQLGLKLNPGKCKALHLSGKHPVGLREMPIRIDNKVIPTLHDYEPLKYLGRPVGFVLANDVEDLRETINAAKKIMESALAPWQRLDALRTFIYPALNFAMSCGTLGKTEWRNFDDLLKPMIKQTLYLPQPATTLYLYRSRKGGGCGIPIAAEMSNLSRVDNAFKSLTSRDPEVARLAITELQHTVSKRLRRDVNTEDIEAFLNSNTEGDFRGASNPFRSTWTEARKASGRLNITWELSNDAGPAITRARSTITHNARTKLMAKLRANLCKERDAELQQLPNQGKAIEAVAADPASSHFMTTGDYMTFVAWRFIHKARLNQLPLNGVQPWNATADKRCRRCCYASESLPHVLCHCMEKRAAYTERHNKIVQRVKSVARMRYSIISENKPVGDTNLRPHSGRDSTF